MSKKDMLKQGKNADLLDHATVRHGLKLSDVRYDALSKLRANPQNTVLFREETPEYFARLRDDIRERGVIVPLIAKLDGTLLAGHNRLRVAAELGLKEIPVQYLLETLSPEEEKSFVVKDNLLRRQFTYEQWVTIFRELVPNYEERLFEESRGRKRSSKEATKETAKEATKETTAAQKKKNGQVSEFPQTQSLTQEIASRTSLNERTVRRINEAAREKIQPKKVESKKIKPSSVAKKDTPEKDRPESEELVRMAETLALYFTSSDARTQKRIQKLLQYVLKLKKDGE
jgi:ParB-like chromosome segregation protein Spo0J